MKVTVTNGPVTITVEKDFVTPEVAQSVYDAVDTLVKAIHGIKPVGKPEFVIDGPSLRMVLDRSNNADSAFAKGGVIMEKPVIVNTGEPKHDQ